MAVKNKLGKPKNMPLGRVRYALKRCETNGNVNSAYYHDLKSRLAELGAKK